MTIVEWAQVLLPIGCAIGAGILIGCNWKAFNDWLDRTIERSITTYCDGRVGSSQNQE